MPLPFILGAGAAVAALAGAAGGIYGATAMKEANDTMKKTQERHQQNIVSLEKNNIKTSTTMDRLGKRELEVLKSFKNFSDVFEKIHNRPEFQGYEKGDVALPKYDAEELQKVSIGAGVLLGGLGGAALGTAGGFAAAGAATAGVMALGTASTGTAIASLSGAALTNATLAALGGGAIAAGGGGMALGATILSATTLGAGLLVGGIIFGLTGNRLSEKADEAKAQMLEAEREMEKICGYLKSLNNTASSYLENLNKVDAVYQKHLSGLTTVVEMLNKTDWNTFTPEEKVMTENTVLLVGLLYQMCKVQIVYKAEDSDLNKINYAGVAKAENAALDFLKTRGLGYLGKGTASC